MYHADQKEHNLSAESGQTDRWTDERVDDQAVP